MTSLNNAFVAENKLPGNMCTAHYMYMSFCSYISQWNKYAKKWSVSFNSLHRT